MTWPIALICFISIVIKAINSFLSYIKLVKLMGRKQWTHACTCCANTLYDYIFCTYKLLINYAKLKLASLKKRDATFKMMRKSVNSPLNPGTLERSFSAAFYGHGGDNFKAKKISLIITTLTKNFYFIFYCLWWFISVLIFFPFF